MDPKILKIDPLALDEEWLKQSSTFFYWAQKASEARAEADKARFYLDRLEADLALKIRKDPDAFDLDKTTEAAISQRIKIDDDYETQSLALIDARKEAEDLSKFVSALEQRRKALENLCFLQNQAYYGQPQEKPALIRNTERKKRGVKRTKE